MSDTVKYENERRQIIDTREIIKARFTEYFGAGGYAVGEPGPLIPENDDSVLFTGAATNTMKPYLHGDKKIPNEKLHMVQTCLRTQNLKSLQDEAKSPRWASYFTILGAIAEPEHINDISERSWEFFTKGLGIPESRLKVRIASKDIDLMEFWKNSGYDLRKLELDANEPIYYTHKYGIEGVAGRNYNLAVVEKSSGELRDLGNVIVIEDKEKLRAVEVGFGVETMVSNLLGLPSAINATLMADIVPIQNPAALKLADALSSSIAILDTGQVSPRGKKGDHRGRTLKHYLQGVINLREGAGFSIDEVHGFAERFEQQEFGGSSIVSEKIREYIAAHQKYTKQQLTEHKFNENMAAIIQNLSGVGHMPRRSLSSRIGSLSGSSSVTFG